MKKGIARMGIFGLFPLFASPCFAFSGGNLPNSEIMFDPRAIADTWDEWPELYNPGIEPLKLPDTVPGDDGSNRQRFDSDLLILPGEFLSLARSTDHGFVADSVYDNLTSANANGELVLRDGSSNLVRFDYGSRVGQAGISSALQQLSMTASNYRLTPATRNSGTGDLGAPGRSPGVLQAPPAVPLPAASWMFISGLLAVSTSMAIKSISSTPPVIPATVVNPINPVIPGTPVNPLNTVIPGTVVNPLNTVIPAQAGISKWPTFPTPGPILSLRKTGGLQS